MHLVVLAARRLEVELQDEHAHDREVDAGEAQPDEQREQVGDAVARAEGDEVEGGHLDEAAGKEAVGPEDVHEHGHHGRERRVDDEQLRRDKEERELDGLGDAAEQRGERDGDEEREELLALVRPRGGVERRGDAGDAEDLCPAGGGDGSPRRDGGDGRRGRGELRQGVGPGADDAAAHEHAVVVERRVEQMVQAKRHEHPLEEHKDARARHAGAHDHVLKPGDKRLDVGPDEGRRRGEWDHGRERDRVHESGAREGAEPLGELDVEELVMQGDDHARDDERADHAHVERLYPRHHGKAGGATGLGREVDAQLGAPGLDDVAQEVAEREVADERLHAAACLLLVRKADGQRDGKEKRQLVKHGPAALEDDVPALAPEGSLGGDGADGGLGRAQRADADDDAREREQQHGREHRPAETLDFLHHGRSPRRARQRVSGYAIGEDTAGGGHCVENIYRLSTKRLKVPADGLNMISISCTGSTLA